MSEAPLLALTPAVISAALFLLAVAMIAPKSKKENDRG